VRAAIFISATFINALGTQEFPHCRRNRSRLRPFFGCNDMELIMAEHRRTAHSRKAATRKAASKRTRKTTVRKASSARRKPWPKKASPKRWSQRVTQESDALDLKHGVFKQATAKTIAASLKRSAERSSRRKTGAYRSALSMLTFYINRAGKTLPKTQRDRLQRAKMELRRQFHRGRIDRHTRESGIQ